MSIDLKHTPRDLEKGVIYFFFRPRLETENVSSLNDVQISYLLLHPTKSDVSSVQNNLRMIQIPEIALSVTGTHQRLLAFLISKDESVNNSKNDIEESKVSNATREGRFQPDARLVAEKVYVIYGDQHGRRTHFAYLLTLPSATTAAATEGLS
jgi:hypothetical protein